MNLLRDARDKKQDAFGRSKMIEKLVGKTIINMA